MAEALAPVKFLIIAVLAVMYVNILKSDYCLIYLIFTIMAAIQKQNNIIKFIKFEKRKILLKNEYCLILTFLLTMISINKIN